ncbi:ISAs1 family transposase, partial [Francisellaceae bacterium]|nr:ISAs1 family transposase [Francisellaceae bacterium]
TKHFLKIKDPRVSRQKKHELSDIFFMTLCAVICGADNWVMIEQFCEAKKDWFCEQLGLENGIPSHDTFSRVFSIIDLKCFGECFSNWVNDLVNFSAGEVIAIDGKCLRRSLDKASGKSAIHMVSAWACDNQQVLGQVTVSDKSNEITAIPKLLTILDITDMTITIDAMGCQRAIAQQIIDQQGHYVFSLKGNQGTLHKDVALWFESKLNKKLYQHQTIDGDHGRVETRTITTSDDIEWLQGTHNWPGLKSIIAVTSEREISENKSIETRYFISDIPAIEVDRIAKSIRVHWSIENKLHWSLDMAFDEDHSRARVGNSAANLSVIRHIALNLLKVEKSLKVGIKTKRARAGWDHSYLLKIIFGN